MAHIKRVAVCDGADHLSKEVNGNFLGQATFGVDKGEKIALVNVFEDKVAGESEG